MSASEIGRQRERKSHKRAIDKRYCFSIYRTQVATIKFRCNRPDERIVRGDGKTGENGPREIDGTPWMVRGGC